MDRDGHDASGGHAADGPVRFSIDDGVAVLRLDDPAHRNALSKELNDALAAAVGRALDGGARAIVLTTAPPVFCACGSLDALLDRRVPLADMYAGTTRSCGAAAASGRRVTSAG